MSISIGGLMFGGILTGYVQSARKAEWSAYSLAAQSLAMQQLESVRAAKWDLQASPPVDMVKGTNFPSLAEVLDVPVAGGVPVMATSTVYITTISSDPPLKMIRVDTVWPFGKRGTFTNSIATYRAPDQ
jgi:hypothetical protein